MTGATPAPPFQWEDWYAAVGGRTIAIDEVDQILRKIYDDQYRRFDGPVAPIQRRFESTADAARHVKEQATAFGADIVGICRIEPSDVYAGRAINETHAIAVGQRMRWREFEVVPSRESAIECLRVYFTLGETVIRLADYVRSLGYRCQIEHPIGDSDLLHIPIGLKAGFGSSAVTGPSSTRNSALCSEWEAWPRRCPWRRIGRSTPASPASATAAAPAESSVPPTRFRISAVPARGAITLATTATSSTPDDASRICRA